jgi:hypothetical protein
MCKRPVMHRDSLSSSLDNSLASHKKRPRSLCFKPVFSRRKDSLIGDGVAGGDDDGAACLRNGPVVIFFLIVFAIFLFPRVSPASILALSLHLFFPQWPLALSCVGWSFGVVKCKGNGRWLQNRRPVLVNYYISGGIAPGRACQQRLYSDTKYPD